MSQPTMRGTVTLQVELTNFPVGSAQDVAAAVQNALGGDRAEVKIISAYFAVEG